MGTRSCVACQVRWAADAQRACFCCGGPGVLDPKARPGGPLLRPASPVRTRR